MINQQRAVHLLNTHLGRSLAGATALVGGAVAYNQFTEDDINPLFAAGIGAAAGYGSKVVQNRMMPQPQEVFLLSPSDRRVNITQPVNNEVITTEASPIPRLNPARERRHNPSRETHYEGHTPGLRYHMPQGRLSNSAAEFDARLITVM